MIGAWAATGTVTISTLALLVSEGVRWRPGVWIFKMLAASSFVALAVLFGALDHAYGTWILAGLAASWIGDLLLIRRDDERWFLGGLVAFLSAHLCYIGAFVQLPHSGLGLAAGAGLFATTGAVAAAWLLPHVEKAMRAPVVVYMLAISAMVILAASAVAAGAHYLIAVGAFAFYCSDLAVARDRFVEPSFANGLWGLPTYFGAQAVIAWTVSLN